MLHRAFKKVGIIGLGLMGQSIAGRLLSAGVHVHGYDIDPHAARALHGKGGVPEGDVRNVFKSCDLVILSLPSHIVVSEVLGNVRNEIRSIHYILDSSTGDPWESERFQREIDRLGGHFLDATVSGNSAQAGLGEALWMVGGTEEEFARSSPLLRLLANKFIHTGACGTAARMKLVTNLVLGLNRAALAEGLVFAGGLGLDLATSLGVLRESMAYSRIMDTKGDKMVARDFQPQAKLSQHLKDVRLILESAAQGGHRLPLSETHRALLELSEQLGLGGLDNSALIQAIEALRVGSAPPQSGTHRE